MENPSSPSVDSMNRFFEGFRNLYAQSQSNNNNVDIEDTNRNRAIAPSPSLPLNPNYNNLVFRSTTVAAPMTPPRMTYVSAAGEPPQNLGDANNDGVFIECPEITMLRSLGLIGMMTCSKGSSLFPRLLNRCSENLLLWIGINVTSDNTTFLSLASHPTGSVTVRSLLRHSGVVDDLIFTAVCNNFFNLMISKNGRHLIIPTLRAVDRYKKEILYALAADYSINLATQETGCAALNEFLHEIRGVHRDRILELIAMNAVFLAHDPYGNFVVQNVLALQNPFTTSRIASMLQGNFASLSVQRYGSFIVEKCLKSPYGRDHVLDEFRESKDWIRVAKDEFGNFVAQSTLKILKELGSPVYDELVKKLKPHFVEMLHGHGRSTLKTIQTLEEERVEGNPRTGGTQKRSV